MKRHGSMNHIYRLVWSNATNSWVAVAENARGRGKSSRRKLVAAALSLMAIGAEAGPTGGQVTTGSGSIVQNGSTTTVNQASQNLSLNWSTFNIAPQETVNFVQPSASAIAVNRIFDTNGSQILGHLNANGQVFLINPNGILFGNGAQVNVGGLVASTLDVSDSSLSGNVRSFSGNGTGSIVNQGTINAASGGYVALLGNHVSNQGTVTAQLGTVALGSGNAVTLTFGGNSLTQVQVDQSVLNSLAENGGLIRADGGRVIMTAGARDAVLASAVNNSGVIEARTVNNQNGTVTLLGGMAAGTVNVGGTLDASASNGGNGGFIETSAARVKVANDSMVTTASRSGLTGTWLIDPTDFTIAPSGGDITGAQLGANLNMNFVDISSSHGTSGTNGNINVNDAVSWSANNPLTLTASNSVNVNYSITASGATAALTITPGTGSFNLGPTASINLPNVSSSVNTALTIAGTSFYVINSLGAQGSVSGTDLQGIQGNLSRNYALGSNINASATSGWNSGAGFATIAGAVNPPNNSGSPLPAGSQFSGTFDGLGHTISGLTIDAARNGTNSPWGVGLFGWVGTSGVVRNVGLTGTSISLNGASYAGALVGLNYGTVKNSYSTGSINAITNASNGVGGLVGENIGTLSNSYSSATISAVDGSNFVGGLVGMNFGGSIANSHASGNVTASGPTSLFAGGLVGYGNGGSISNSYATGNVTGSSYAGGLIGRNSHAQISNSYATGSVSGSTYVGGLAGSNYGFAGASTINNSYSTGSVSGSSNTGGLVGQNSDGASGHATTVNNSFWDTSTSGQPTSAGGEVGMTTAQMQTKANFTSATSANGSANPAWDFSGTWTMVDGATYPLLISGMTPLSISANATKVYDGSVFSGSPNVVYSTAPNFGLLTGSLTYSGTYTSAGSKNVGSYTITPAGYASSSQDGYFISYQTGAVQVTPLALVGTLSAGSSTYGAALVPGTVNFTNVVSGDVVTAGTVTVNTTGLTSTSGHLIAGTHNGIESVGTSLGGPSAGNYTYAGATGNYTVSPLALTGSITTGSSTYGSALSAGTASFTNAVSGDALGTATVSVNTTGLTSTSGHLTAGTHSGIESVSALSGADAGNYTYSGVSGDYTVSPLALIGSITAGSSTYGSAVVPGTASFSNAVTGDVVTPSAVTITTTGLTSTSGNLTAGTHTGIESITSTVGGADAGNYTFAGATGDYTVSKLALTGSIASGSSVYGASLAPGAAGFTNAVTGDLLGTATVTVNTTGLTSNSGHLIAGSHIGVESVSALSGADGGNYTFAGLSGDYSVSKLALTGSIASGSSVYGASLTPGAVNFTNIVTGDIVTPNSVTVTTTGLTSTSGHLTAGTHSGIETASGISGADAGNYTFGSVTGDYTVTPLALIGSITAGSSTYGSALVAGTASFSNPVTGDDVTPSAVTITTTGLTSTSGNLTAGTHTGIESITSTVGGADAGNYTFAGATGDYTVSKLALTGSIASGSSVYGASLAPGAASFTNAVTGDLLGTATVTVNTIGLTSTSGHLIAGSHTGVESVSALSGADGGNYTFAGLSGDYSVSQLALTGSIAAGSTVYGASLTPGAVNFTNIVTGDVVTPASVTVTTTGLTSTSGHLTAGTHSGIESATGITGADAGNYTFGSVTGDYTVTPLALIGSITAGSSTYGSALVAGSASFSNIVTGDIVTPSAVTITTTGLTSTSGHLTAGTHTGIQSITSTVGGADAGNYSFGGVTGDYTVSKLALSGSIATGSSTYGATLTPGTASLSGSISGDVLGTATVTVDTTGQTSTSGHLIAGSHSGVESVTALSGADGGNYSFAGITGDYTVSQLALIGSIGTGSSTYGASLAPGAVNFTNIVTGDVVTPGAVTVTTTGLTSTSGNLTAGSHTGIESASGISGADAANYTFGSVTGNYSVAPLALTGSITAGSSTYGSALVPGTASFTNAVTGDVLGSATVSVNTTGLTSTSGHLTAGSHTGVQGVSALSGADAGNYTFAGVSGNYSVSQLAVGGSISAGSSTYGATLVPGTASLSGVITGDVIGTVGVSINTTGLTSTSGHLTAGTHTGIESLGTFAGADAGNYNFSGVTGDYTVNQLALTGSITTGSSTYGASLAPGAVSFTNIVTGDVVTPGAVTVTITGHTSTSGNLTAGSHTGIESASGISGADAANYTFGSVTGNYTVTPLALTGSITAGSSTYGGVLVPGAASLSGAITGDVLGSATVGVTTTGLTSTSGHLTAGSHTGIETVTGLSGADGGNYSFAGITGDYSVATLALSGTVATGSSTYGSALSPGVASFSNLVSGDVVTTPVASVTTTGLLSSSGNLTAGTHAGIETVGSTLTGTDAANYTFTGASGNYTVTPLALNGSIATGSSVYGAALTPGAVTLSNLIAGDNVSTPGASVSITGQTSSSGHLTAGLHSGIESASGTLSGTDAGNYSFGAITGDYNVSKLPVSISATGSNKVYDATTAATVVLSSSGVIAGDSVSVSSSGASFADKNVGTGKTITVNGVDFSGADAGNYQVNSLAVTTTANITPLAITPTATGSNKVYDGSTAAVVSLTGGLSGDSISFTDTSATFGSKDVGTGKTITVSGITASGADAGNYTVSGSTTTSANITPASLTYTATPSSVIAGQAPTGLSGSVSGFVGGDTLGSSTSGTLAWTTPATTASQPGQYAINGSGLSATDYLFVQAAGNATALTLKPGTAPIAAQNVITVLDALFWHAAQGWNLASLDFVPFEIEPHHNDIELIDHGTRGAPVQVINGGVKLPDDIVNTHN